MDVAESNPLAILLNIMLTAFTVLGKVLLQLFERLLLHTHSVVAHRDQQQLPLRAYLDIYKSIRFLPAEAMDDCVLY
ncbi:hypothetical protein D3C77_649900 [compost metagenome]